MPKDGTQIILCNVMISKKNKSKKVIKEIERANG